MIQAFIERLEQLQLTLIFEMRRQVQDEEWVARSSMRTESRRGRSSERISVESQGSSMETIPKPRKTLSPALEQCLMLKYKIDDHPFGYFFRYPVNPYQLKLPDYYKIVRRPIDLMTIQRKLITTIYKKYEQFDEDMHLMFNNALLYNRNNRGIVEEVENLRKFYVKEFDELDMRVRKNILSEEFPRVEERDPLIDGRREEKLKEVWTEERKKELGMMIQFLKQSTKKKLLYQFEMQHPQIEVMEKQGNKMILFNRLDHRQLFDLLKLAMKMKAEDFDTAQLMTVEVDPLLEGHNDHFGDPEGDEEVESSFEIESDRESDSRRKNK